MSDQGQIDIERLEWDGKQRKVIIEGEEYIVTFNDEFNDDTNTFWAGYGSRGVWATSFAPTEHDSRWLTTNNELQYYADPDTPALPNPFRIADGALHISASELTAAQRELADGQGYGSGLLNTQPTFSFGRGYVEMRADIPAQTGFWSAFWMLPEQGGWSSEIDIAEILGETADTLHTNAWRDGVPAAAIHTDLGLGDGFHTFGLLWEDDALTWLIDDVVVRTLEIEITDELYLAIALAVGGWAETPDHTTDFNDTLAIDYIRVYEETNAPDRNTAVGWDRFNSGKAYFGEAGEDSTAGSRWDDRMHGFGGDDTFYGNSGDDFLTGNMGDDRLYGERGEDVLRGGSGADAIYGGDGDDWLHAGAQDDEAFGGAGDDILIGASGGDKLIGGAGEDRLAGGRGDDHLWGGGFGGDTDADTFVYQRADGKDFIHDFTASLDRIDLSAMNLDWASVAGALNDKGWATKVELSDIGGARNDAIWLKGVTAEELTAESFIF